MTLTLVSWISLLIILGVSVAMAASCYESGILGCIAAAGMAMGALVVMLDFSSYALSKPTVVLEAGVAGFLARHYWRFHLFRRRRKREDAQVIDYTALSGR